MVVARNGVPPTIGYAAGELIRGVFNEATRTTATIAAAIEEIDDQLTNNDRHDLQGMFLDARHDR